MRLSEQGFSGGTEGAPPSRVLCAKVGLLFYASLHIALSQRARVDDAVEVVLSQVAGVFRVERCHSGRVPCVVAVFQVSAILAMAWSSAGCGAVKDARICRGRPILAIGFQVLTAAPIPLLGNFAS